MIISTDVFSSFISWQIKNQSLQIPLQLSLTPQAVQTKAQL